MKKKYNYWMLFILMVTGLLCGCGATRKIAEYEGTPVAITYSENGEAHNEWQITDIATINACEQALKQLAISKKTELRSADAGETFVFQMADGGWSLKVEICCRMASVMRQRDGRKSGKSYKIILKRRDCDEITIWKEGRNLFAYSAFSGWLWRENGK